MPNSSDDETPIRRAEEQDTARNRVLLKSREATPALAAGQGEAAAYRQM